MEWVAVQPMHQKLRRGVIVRSLLAALVVVVVVMAINDSTRSTYRETSPPVGRAVAEAPLPDLSEAGFRLGGLAVSPVSYTHLRAHETLR